MNLPVLWVETSPTTVLTVYTPATISSSGKQDNASEDQCRMEQKDLGKIKYEEVAAMQILVVEPECRPEVRDIDGSLKTMQEIVGGLIQPI